MINLGSALFNSHEGNEKKSRWELGRGAAIAPISFTVVMRNDFRLLKGYR